MAALYIITAAVSVSADGIRGDAFSHTMTYSSAQIHCQGSLSGNTVSASISISFIPSLDHPPASDYSSGILVRARDLGGNDVNTGNQISYNSPSNLYSTYSFTWGAKKPITSAECRFFVNEYPTLTAPYAYKKTLNQ